MARFYEILRDYQKENIYPFHMPGHKRNPSVCSPEFPAGIDITEITGFDNLHDPQDILLEAQRAAAELYGVRETWYSVNGSSGAILAAVSACVPRGGRILIARNCHKAVYNAVSLRGLDCDYVYPGSYSRCGISGGIRPDDVAQALKAKPGVKAVLITSPTYDGIVSDIKEIARVVHDAGAVLIVDAAHGAHFAFHEIFPEPAERQGADLVIISIHKTLPSLTQTALLHRCSDRVDRDKIQRFLSVYQTSSPSYVLMAGMDACVARLEREGKELFSEYADRLLQFRSSHKDCRILSLLDPLPDPEEGISGFDPSKILISTEAASFGGPELHKILHDRFRIECEMEGPEYVLALSSVGDTQEGFDRLREAVFTLDKEEQGMSRKENAGCVKEEGDLPGEKQPAGLPVPEAVMRIADAEDAVQESVPLEESIGRISGEYAFVYPPGIPLIVPGEKISGEFVSLILEYQKRGLNLKGFCDREFKKIQTVKKTGG